jgi:hypothetical protein
VFIFLTPGIFEEIKPAYAGIFKINTLSGACILNTGFFDKSPEPVQFSHAGRFEQDSDLGLRITRRIPGWDRIKDLGWEPQYFSG